MVMTSRAALAEALANLWTAGGPSSWLFDVTPFLVDMVRLRLVDAQVVNVPENAWQVQN